MQIIIRGKRSEGKTTLACLLETFLKENTSAVTSFEEQSGSRGNRVPSLPPSTRKIAERYFTGIRRVDIVVENTNQDVWDGTVLVTNLDFEKIKRRDEKKEEESD
jgi:hypothetical protein